MSSSLASINECFICEDELISTDDVICTDCNHMLHRRCAQKRVDTKQKSNCPVCHRDAAVGNALAQDIINSSKNVTNEDETISISNTGSRMSDEAIDYEGTDTNKQEHVQAFSAMSLHIVASTTDSSKTPEQQDEIQFQETKFSSATINTLIESGVIVYVSDLPSHLADDDDDDDVRLANLIQNCLEKSLDITPMLVKCYSKLDVGLIYVRDNQMKTRLVGEIRQILLDSMEYTCAISFHDTIELVSYVVIEQTNDRQDLNFPKPDEILRQWADIYNGQRPTSCHQISVQFPNIYRIVSTSFDEVLTVMAHPDFLVNKLFAHVYVGADCSYLEDLSRSTTKKHLERAIEETIGVNTLPSLSLHIELNKQTSNACIITTDRARPWKHKDYLILDGKQISRKENLTYRLLVRPILDVHNTDEILSQKLFNGQAKLIAQYPNKLLLEITNKKIYNECLKFCVLRVGTKPILYIENYVACKDPEELEIDAETWYEHEMVRYKPDIMQFIADLDHPVFRYRWNAQIWIQQFQNTRSQNRPSNVQSSLSPDQIRHLLQMTVMLNTIGVIRDKTYLLRDQPVTLNLDPNIKTIVYNHESLLEYGHSVKLTATPYMETKVKVINDDCIRVYEDCCHRYKKPLLLHMASGTSPGDGYRKGDGAQEENLFRRSDYFRSLDNDLDSIQEQQSPPQRFHCSHQGQVHPLVDHSSNSSSMYPMDEYGAIYTSGVTFFRKSEDQGYEYMDKPLKGVHALALAAYRNPKLDGNMLSPRYAIGMRKKIESLFSIAHHHEHDCLVLLALGRGAFHKPSDHVAKLFRSVIEQYAGFFRTVIFAVVDDHNSGQQHNPHGNYQVFKDELDELTFRPVLSLSHANTMIGPYRIALVGSAIEDVTIFERNPCPLGAKCNQMEDSKHTHKFSHPALCNALCMNNICRQVDDPIHMTSFIHRNPCKHGAQCKDIDDVKHSQEYEHPSYCLDKENCQDTSTNHEQGYRHLPLCTYFQKCPEYQKRSKSHCEKFRHCTLSCELGNNCLHFHDRQHMNRYKHPFPTPCPFTPYHCSFYEQFRTANNTESISYEVDQHCLDYAHVCRFGRQCTNKDPLHFEKSIHIQRLVCPSGGKCTRVVQENHLNSFTHPNIRDIRFLCKRVDQCQERHDLKHIVKFRHIFTSEETAVVRYDNLNNNIDFVQNQKDNIERVIRYVEQEKWEALPSGIIPRNIINWVRTVRPVHRCRPEILESILRHGHVMSRDYMEHLKNPLCIVDSILQHSHLTQIEYSKEKKCAQNIKSYVTALVFDQFEKHQIDNANAVVSPASLSLAESPKQSITSTEVMLSYVLSQEQINIIRTTAIEIAQASLKLHSDPTGVGYQRDKELGTSKNVFSVLGPHLGNYGDVFIVFKREILHHPDSNFSIQSATSYASGNCFKWRPWLETNPGSEEDRIRLFHKTKLHAAIPGYEYATALELIATVSRDLKKESMNIDFDTILKRWLARDSHMNIEGHLPQLIPLDYIDHIYMPKEVFDSFDTKSCQAISTLFDTRLSIKPFPSLDDYRKFVIADLVDKFDQCDTNSVVRPIEGIVITIPPTDFTDYFLLPLTISQAFEQYRIKHPHASFHTMTVYIYWQAMNGDMMLTLSNQQIGTTEHQSDLRCLTAYIAEKP